jgi:hypothetical protein
MLMISDVYPPRINGVSTSIQTFRRQLNALGQQVVLIVPDYSSGQEVGPGILLVPLAPDARAYLQEWGAPRMTVGLLAF